MQGTQSQPKLQRVAPLDQAPCPGHMVLLSAAYAERAFAWPGLLQGLS